MRGTCRSWADDKPDLDHDPSGDAFVIDGVQGQGGRLGCADSPKVGPEGTEPGRIEVKDIIPAYRSAVARGTGASLGADNVLFFPLFKPHQLDSEIAMTTPVVSTYSDELVKDPKATGAMVMEFVYRTPTHGPDSARGWERSRLRITRRRPHSSAWGFRATSIPERLRKGVEVVRAWISDHKEEWVEDGLPRRLGYHGPDDPASDQRLWEVQIPIKAVPKTDPGPGQALSHPRTVISRHHRIGHEGKTDFRSSPERLKSLPPRPGEILPSVGGRPRPRQRSGSGSLGPIRLDPPTSP